MVQDQRTLREDNLMGFSRGTAGLRHEEREHVNKFAGAARHMHMCNHIYFADPHLSSSQYLSDVKSKSMVDAGDKHTVPARCFYGNSPMIGPSTSNNSAFAAAARPSDRSCDGTENGYYSLAMESSEDQLRRKLKMFPFMVAAFQEPGLRMMTGQQVMATGPSLCAHRPSFPSSSSRPVLTSEALTKASSEQLTIFYKGQVNVYDHVVPAKVQNIMLMAAAHDSLPERLELSMKTSDSYVIAECEKLPLIDLNTRSEPDESEVNRAAANLTPIRVRMMQEDETDSSVAGPNNNFVEEEPLVPQALPQARKASLCRFLERRRERLMAKSPYSVERPSY